jgi:hypothetical protein
VLTVRGSSRRSGANNERESTIRDVGQGRFKVTVANRDSLRALISASATDSRPVNSLTAVVKNAKAPRWGWSGQPGIQPVSASLAWNDSGFESELIFGQPVTLSIALAAVARMSIPLPTGSRAPDIAWVSTALPKSGLAAETLTTLVGQESDPHLRFTDLVITDSTVVNVGHGSLIQVNGNRWLGSDAARDVYVDPLVHRPLGRRSVTSGEIVSATELDLPEYLDTPTVRSLKDVAMVRGAESLTEQQRVQLRASGVVLSNNPIDASEIDAISVAGRCVALREHTAQPLIYGWPSVTMILATHRPDFLHRIVEMLSQQTYPVLELVVLTHGFDLDDHIGSHLSELRYPVIHQELPSHVNLGEVLAVGTSLASGELITKIDDDDFYGPEHVWDLVIARMYSGAQIVGKALDHIYLAAQDRTVFRPTYAAEKYADFVAGGTMLISQGDLRSVGGWRPVPKSVDRALLDRVAQHGGLVYRTHGRGYIYVRHGDVRHGDVRHGDTHTNTSVVSDAHFETKNQGSTPGVDRSVLADYGSFA